MPFKRKSKKVFRKRSRRERSHKNINKNRTKKRSTRKRLAMQGGVKDLPDLTNYLDSKTAAVAAAQKNSRKKIQKKNDAISKLVRSYPNTKSQKGIGSANVAGPDYTLSEDLAKIREKYKEDKENLHIINKNIERREGLHRAADGPIIYLEFPDATNGKVPAGEVPRDVLLKFVIVQDTYEEFHLLYSVAHYPHVPYVEWFIKKYFDNDLNLLGWPGRNVVLITSDMLNEIDKELIEITGYGVLGTKTFVPGFDLNGYLNLYLKTNITVIDIGTEESRAFNPNIDTFMIESSEVEHSALPINSNIQNLKRNEKGENVVFSASEGVVFPDGTYILDSTSGHYQPDSTLVVIRTTDLLKSKGYKDVKDILPPPDKPHYRGYVTTAGLHLPRPIQSIDGTFDKRLYDAIRNLLRSAKYKGNIDDPTIRRQIDARASTMPSHFKI